MNTRQGATTRAGPSVAAEALLLLLLFALAGLDDAVRRWRW